MLQYLRRALRAAPPAGSADALIRFFSNKLHSGAKKRFRGTARGALKRKAAGNRHNTGLKRPGTQARKRASTELVASPAIVRRIKAMIGAR
jgi:ribosomal protein L35